MIWNKYVIHTTTKDADIISAVLYDYNIKDIQIEDNVQLTDEELNRMYADFVKELPEDDGSCTINFYLDEDECIPGSPVGTGDSPSLKPGIKVDLDGLKNELNDACGIYGTAPVTIECMAVNNEDWENKWKEAFKPFEVDGIIIKPTWEEMPEDSRGKAVINIDPGMAFGTGMHETTRLCLKGLKKYLKPGYNVLDLGCGSGILGIAALKLGAEAVTGVDIDEQAVKIACENFELNTSEVWAGLAGIDGAGGDAIRAGGEVLELNALESGAGLDGVDGRPVNAGCEGAELSALEVWAGPAGIDGAGGDAANAGSEVLELNALESGAGLDGADGKAVKDAGPEQNKVVYQLHVGDILNDECLRERLSSVKYDIVLANILAEVVCKIIRDVHNYMKEGAVFIASGILNEKEKLVREAVKANPHLEIIDVAYDGDWCQVTIQTVCLN